MKAAPAIHGRRAHLITLAGESMAPAWRQLGRRAASDPLALTLRWILSQSWIKGCCSPMALRSAGDFRRRGLVQRSRRSCDYLL